MSDSPQTRRLKYAVEACVNGIWGDEPNGVDDLVVVRVADFDREKARVALGESPTVRAIPASARNRRMLFKGDLLIEKSGGGELQPVGNVVLFEDERPAVCSNFVARMPVVASCDSRFVAYVFRAMYAEAKNVPHIKQTSGIQNLDSESYLNELAWLPSRSDQERIANFLDEQTARIDALIAEKEALIKRLDEYTEAAIADAVLGSSHKSRELVNVPEIGSIPKAWRLVPMMRLTAPDRPIMYGIVLPGPNVEAGPSVPIVKGGDVRPHRLQLESLNRTTPEIEAPFARARLRPLDIVYSIRGTIGDAELVPAELEGANITQDVARISPGPDVEPRWLLYAAKSRPVFAQLEQLSLGAAVRGINIFDLKRARVPTPPRAEQARIASYLDGLVGSLAALREHSLAHVARLREYRSSLISAAVTGQIDLSAFKEAA